MPFVHFIPDNKVVEAKEGESIRDVAIKNDIPLAHVCGGNGRCSTCRILVIEGLQNCSPRTKEEQAIADFLTLGRDIRLACQTTVKGDVKVRRLTLDESDIELTSRFIMSEQTYLAGVEKDVFIMFVDIRGFTAFAEFLLPYDVIHVLHRFFHFMNIVTRKYGGHIDSYIGDGFMALFEVENPEKGALSAIKAGLEMIEVLNSRICPYVEQLFGKSFDIGIGLHYGKVVAGTIGGSESKKTTVIGDAVNFASRIEAANKQIGSRFLISKDTYEKVSDFVQANQKIRIKIPGKAGDHTLYEVIGLK